MYTYLKGTYWSGSHHPPGAEFLTQQMNKACFRVDVRTDAKPGQNEVHRTDAACARGMTEIEIQVAISPPSVVLLFRVP